MSSVIVECDFCGAINTIWAGSHVEEGDFAPSSLRLAVQVMAATRCRNCTRGLWALRVDLVNLPTELRPYEPMNNNDRAWLEHRAGGIGV